MPGTARPGRARRRRAGVVGVVVVFVVTVAVASVMPIAESGVVRAEPADGPTNLAIWGADPTEYVPSGTDFVDVAGGSGAAIALRADGSLLGWGFQNYGQTDVPPGNDYVAIAVGQFSGYALNGDGEIVGWGTDVDGSLDVPPGADFTTIASGAGHGLALTPDGAIVGWGYDEYGQATAPPGTGYRAIAAGIRHSVAIRSDGSLLSWGDDTYGQLASPPGTDFVAVAAGHYTSVARRADGSLVGWGWDANGVAHPPPGTGYVDADVGLHGVARRADGSLVAWGADNYGQATPPAGNGFVAVAVADSYSIAVTQTALTAPRSVKAQVGHGSATVSWLPPATDAGSRVTSYEVLSSSDWQSCTTTGALSCTVEGLQNDKAYTFTVRARNAIDVGPWSAPSASITPVASAYGELTALTPARVLDTRDGNGRGGVVGPLEGGHTFEVQITGRGGVAPQGVTAVAMNVTVTGPTAPSHLVVWPVGVPMPETSNLNVVPGQTVANLVTVAVGAEGKVAVFNAFGATDVIFDVVGFYADDFGPPGSRFHSVAPSRIFDSRFGTGGVPAVPLGPDGTLEFKVFGQGGVPPADVSAVVLNVTVTQPTQASHLTVYPGDVQNVPTASNLNYVPGLTVPNLVVVRVPTSGLIRFHNAFGDVDVIADVVGYYDRSKYSEAGRFIGFVPERVFDSRWFDGGAWGPDEWSLVGDFPGFAGIALGTADSVMLNVTAAGPTAASHIAVFPSDNCTLPNSSNLNFVPGRNVGNQVIVGLGATQGCALPDEVETVSVYNLAGRVEVIIDLFGAFTGP